MLCDLPITLPSASPSAQHQLPGSAPQANERALCAEPGSVPHRAAEVVACSSCGGRGAVTVRESFSGGFAALCDQPCDACDATGYAVRGVLPPANETAAQLEAFLAGERVCTQTDVPDHALEIVALAAAVLRAAAKVERAAEQERAEHEAAAELHGVELAGLHEYIQAIEDENAELRTAAGRRAS